MIVSAKLATASKNEFRFRICDDSHYRSLMLGDRNTGGGTEVIIVGTPEEYQDLVGEEILIHFSDSKAYLLPCHVKEKTYPMILLNNVTEHESE